MEWQRNAITVLQLTKCRRGTCSGFYSLYVLVDRVGVLVSNSFHGGEREIRQATFGSSLPCGGNGFAANDEASTGVVCTIFSVPFQCWCACGGVGWCE